MQPMFAVFWLKIDEIVWGNRITRHKYCGSFVFFTFPRRRENENNNLFQWSNAQCTDNRMSLCLVQSHAPNNIHLLVRYPIAVRQKPPKKNRSRVSKIKETTSNEMVGNEKFRFSVWIVLFENWNCLKKTNIDTITLRKNFYGQN